MRVIAHSMLNILVLVNTIVFIRDMNVGAVGIEPKNDLGDICHGGFEKFCARENFTGT